MEEIIMFSAEWWSEPLGTWMAWTRTTIAFFLFLVSAITTMGLIERAYPGGAPRTGDRSPRTGRADRTCRTLSA